MAAWLVFFAVAAIAVKTASYGVWEIKRENILGGIFAFSIAFLDILLAAKYLINYRT